jgi:hypothetical protein
MDAGCGFVGVRDSTRAAYTEQARCTLKLVEAFLAKLRALGAYDRSAILLTSDHGASLAPPSLAGTHDTIPGLPEIVGGALALLAIKSVDATGPLRTSTAPTSIVDLPATIFDLAGLPDRSHGVSALRVPANARRSRSYADYRWRHEDWHREHFEALHRFAIEGPVLDAASWRYVETVFAPDVDLRAAHVDLAAPEARPHLGLGWAPWTGGGAGAPRALRAVGATATLFLSLPPDPGVELVARLRAPDGRARRVVVSVDGREVGSFRAGATGEFEDHALALPPDADRPAASTITFGFEPVAGGGAPDGGAGGLEFERVSVRTGVAG